MRITTRTKKIDKKGIHKIRLAKLNQNPKKARYILSKKFETDLKHQIKMNRVKETNKMLSRISKSIGNTTRQQQTLTRLFGEKTIYRDGKKRTINKFGTLSQYNRVKNAYKQMEKGTFNLKRRVSKSTKYKEVKQYLPDDSTNGAILDSLDRSAFYFENRNLIIRHNKGDVKASRVLKKTYDIDQTEKRVSILGDM